MKPPLPKSAIRLTACFQTMIAGSVISGMRPCSGPGIWSPIILLMGLSGCGCVAGQEPKPDMASALYTQEGTDPASVVLPTGSDTTVGATGSIIHVNKRLVDVGPNAGNEIPKSISIHTLGNSHVPRKDFAKWTRWYQEDGNTQIFRLFKDEANARNDRPLSARVEAFSGLHWQRGDWHEWSGTYTIIKPHRAAIFQVKNGGAPNWAMQIDMSDDGDVLFAPRRKPEVVIARNMTGKPFHIRVRDNGHDFEVYLDGAKAGTGFWDRPEGETGFRWGMYLGEHPERHDAMIFVTGAAFQ